MSKLSIIERNKKRISLYKKFKAKHDKLLKLANNKKLSPDEQFQARLKLSKIPRNRFAKIEELASLVAWLVSEENSFSTGAVFDLSGGRATY